MHFQDVEKFYPRNLDIERGLDELELQNLFKSKNRIGNAYKEVKYAIESAINKSNKNEIIFVGGSTFVVAQTI